MGKETFEKLERKIKTAEISENTAYKPLMTEEEIEGRRVFQKKIYEKGRMIREEKEFDILGKKITVAKEVFSPQFESKFLAKHVRKEVRSNDYVLDVGTGTGIQAIFAGEKAKKVVAVDINPAATECAKRNITYHALKRKVEVRESDLFSNVGEKFDLIIFNPPFRWFKPRDMLERANLDEGYKTLQRFFAEAKNHLKEQGRMLMIFATSGDIKYFEQLIRENGFNSEILQKKTQKTAYEYRIYRLTPETVK